MTPLPPAPSCVKLNINWGVEADVLAQTIHYFQYSGGAPSAVTLASWAASVVSAGDSFFGPLCSDQVGMISATFRDLASDMGAEASGGVAWLGSRGSALTPPGAAVVMSHSINRHYRGGKPRTYLPIGVAGDITTSGFWSDALIGSTTGDYANWIGTIAGDTGLVYVNVSYYTGPNRVITNPVTGRARNVSTLRGAPRIDQITESVARKVIGSQRRRNRDA